MPSKPQSPINLTDKTKIFASVSTAKGSQSGMNSAMLNCRFFMTSGNVKGTKSSSIPRSQEQLGVQATTKIILRIVNCTILIRKSLAVNEEGPLRWHCYTAASEADLRSKSTSHLPEIQTKCHVSGNPVQFPLLWSVMISLLVPRRYFFFMGHWHFIPVCMPFVLLFLSPAVVWTLVF